MDDGLIATIITSMIITLIFLGLFTQALHQRAIKEGDGFHYVQLNSRAYIIEPEPIEIVNRKPIMIKKDKTND